MIPLDQLFNAQRRAWLICTVLSLTVLMSWSSIHRLQELVEAEDAHEASDNLVQQSLFSLAEKNVLEHLPQRRAGGLTAVYCCFLPHLQPPRHTAGGALETRLTAPCGLNRLEWLFFCYLKSPISLHALLNHSKRPPGLSLDGDLAGEHNSLGKTLHVAHSISTVGYPNPLHTVFGYRRETAAGRC